MPVYNEERSLREALGRVHDASVHEILAVDDGSADGSWAILEAAAAAMPELKLLRHRENRGKGAAIQTALARVTGDVVLVQDADLEYDPRDYPALLKPIEAGEADVVYGSRILGQNSASYRRYYWGGRVLSMATSVLFGVRITDQHTCYKAFKTPLLRSLPLREAGFGFCAEATALLLRRGVKILEVPVSYRPRSMAQGKKIRWHDGLRALWIALRCRLACSRRKTFERQEA